ncbi:MAG TPA: hypothetical protein DCO83_04590 [Mucilaginibacter sp.]|nr:hypothetical protein [Mucilaginibacter sp.]
MEGTDMPVVKKAPEKKEKHDDIIVSDEVRSYTNDPYFVKKAEKVQEFLREHPISDHLKK